MVILNWQNRFVLLIASFCAALLLAFVALPNYAYQDWSGSGGPHYSWAPKGFGEPKVAQTINSGSYKFPKLTGRVVDNANLINAVEEAKLIEKLKAFEKQSSDQVVVATIDSLHGANLEEYSNLLFREWKLGQAEENNGVLLLVSKNDRKIRIEVGYGLEGLLTDAMSKIIIDRVIVPQFKAGNFSAGIVSAAENIIGVLSGDKFELDSRAKRNVQQNNDVDWFEVIFFIIWGTLFFGPLAFSILAPIFGEKLGPRHYKWLGIEHRPGRGGSGGSSGSGGFGGGYSGGGGGFSGGGGSSGGGGASGGW